MPNVKMPGYAACQEIRSGYIIRKISVMVQVTPSKLPIIVIMIIPIPSSINVKVV